jgi:chromosome segregation ATPase
MSREGKREMNMRDLLIPGNSDASELVEQMDRKDNLFSQIGDYIQKVQAETGNNAVHVKKKLVELEETREKLNAAEGKLTDASHRANQMNAEIAQIRSYNESLRSDIEKLNAVVVAEKGLTQRQSQELSKWQETVGQLRQEKSQLKGESKRADVLQQANVELNDELNKARNDNSEERNELKKSLASLNAQLESTILEKNDVSRHFWNLTEDTKNLKEELEKYKHQAEDAVSNLKEVAEQSRAHVDMADAEKNSLRAQLEQTKAQIDQAVLQASNQKEIEMRNEFKDMLERMGGLQEAQEMHRSEISGLEQERNEAMSALNRQKNETDKVMSMLNQERKKSDGAALEIATLSQNLHTLQTNQKKAAHAIEQGQDEITKFQEEAGKLRAELSIAKSQREEDAQLVAVAMSERDGIMNRYKSDMDQHRQTVESLRKSEQQAAQQVQDLVSKIENYKNENEALTHQVQHGSQGMRSELQNYRNVCEQLSKELEVRLEQLTAESDRADSAEKEASAIRNEVKSKAEELAEREKSWARSYTKEKERLQSEFATIKMRCNALEAEKMDFIKESEEMRKDLKELKAEKERALDSVREQEKFVSELERDVSKQKGEKIELLEELKQVNRREEETQNATSKREQELLSELEDSKTQLKTTKKLSTSQVMEFQSQSEALMKQIMKVQGELAGTQTQLAEKSRLLEEKEMHLSEAKGRMEELQGGYMNELSGSKREVERFKGSALMAAQEARKNSEELEAAKIELSRIGGDARSLRDGKREAENKLRETERQLRHLEEDLAKASDDCTRYRGKAVELEDDLGKAQLTLREVQILNVDLKEKGVGESRVLKEELEKLNDIVRSQEEALEGGRRLVAENQSKYAQLQSTCNATINGLMAELKATEEALVRERERMSHDTEVLRTQIMETERDLDSNVTKYKTTITSLREESDRYRRAAYTLEAETNKLKVQLEGKKREVDRLAAEMEVTKDANRDSERRMAQLKDSAKAAEKEVARMRDEKREFDSMKSVNDGQLGAANAALKSHVVSKDEEINKLKMRLKWTEEENASQVTLLNKEKNGLLMELGLQVGDRPGGKEPSPERLRSHSVETSPERGGQGPNSAYERHNKKQGQLDKNSKRSKALGEVERHLKDQEDYRQALGGGGGGGGGPNWNGIKDQDDLMETPNWPPGNSDKVRAAGAGVGANTRLPSPPVEEDNEHWQSTSDTKGFRPQDASGNFYKEKEGTTSAAINKAADYLAKRKQREASKVAKEANDNDLANNPYNFGDEENVEANVLMSQTGPGQIESGGSGGGKSRTKFPSIGK